MRTFAIIVVAFGCCWLLAPGVVFAQPANDDCANAILIGNGDTGYSNVGAFSDGPAACGLLGSDIWYSYMASCDGMATISTCNQANYNTVLAAYDPSSGCPPPLSALLACNVNLCTLTSSITIAVTSSDQYLIQVGGLDGAQGAGTLTISCVPAAGQDEFVRGDADGNGSFNTLVDAFYILGFGFQGGPPPACMESADVDGDGTFNALVDVLYLLAHGFQGGAPPPGPYPDCGPDPDVANSLGCAPNACP